MNSMLSICVRVCTRISRFFFFNRSNRFCLFSFQMFFFLVSIVVIFRKSLFSTSNKNNKLRIKMQNLWWKISGKIIATMRACVHNINWIQQNGYKIESFEKLSIIRKHRTKKSIIEMCTKCNTTPSPRYTQTWIHVHFFCILSNCLKHTSSSSWHRRPRHHYYIVAAVCWFLLFGSALLWSDLLFPFCDSL